jgi:hypothetical protein
LHRRQRAHQLAAMHAHEQTRYLASLRAGGGRRPQHTLPNQATL